MYSIRNTISNLAIPLAALALTAGLLSTEGCVGRQKHYRISRAQVPRVETIETTGYCKCGTCCGWKRNWRFEPVYASGPNKGKPKKVGITAAGTKADWGTIAADPKRYPFGTIMYVPGYGWGRVEDVGSAISGNHIDLFFPSHKEALEWGRKTRRVKIWTP